jgi:hypothetical protein
VNKGVATPGRVQLPLPPDVTLVDAGTAQVSNGTLTWTFDLAKDQQLGFDAWVRLPTRAGAVAFDSLVQTGTSGNYIDHTHAKLTVNATAQATLAEARALAATAQDFEEVGSWLDKAQFGIDHNRPDFALASLLEATDELIGSTHPQATTLCLQIEWSRQRFALCPSRRWQHSLTLTCDPSA